MDVINEYISKALIADNRGGLNVEKIYQEKLKQKYVKVKQDDNGNSKNNHEKSITSINPFQRKIIELKYQCKAPKRSYTIHDNNNYKKKKKRKRESIKKYTQSILNEIELKQLHHLWNEYWKKSIADKTDSRKNLLQRIRRGLIFTGCCMKIVESTCAQDIGNIGFVLKETCNTFIFQNKLSTNSTQSKNKTDEPSINKLSCKYNIKMIPKQDRVFLLYTPNNKSNVNDNLTDNETILLYGNDFIVIKNKNEKKTKMTTLSSSDMYTMRKV